MMVQQRLLVASALTLLVAAFLLTGCGRSEQAGALALTPSALPQPELVSPVNADPLSGVSDYPAPAGLDAQLASVSPTPTFASRREELQAMIDLLDGEATARTLQYQSDNATAIARGNPPLPTETPIWQPSPVPEYLKPIPGGGFINNLGTRIDMNIRIHNSWMYDLAYNEQIKVMAGGIIRTRVNGNLRDLPEPYQGILVLREYLIVPVIEIGRQMAGEVQIPLPTKDGAAQVLDARVQGGRMLLTIGTTGGSVYVFDVQQRSFSAPQPPMLALAAPETKPDGTVWLQATGEDQAGAMLTYSWDLDGDGVFETEGNPVQLPAGAQVAGRVVTARVTAHSGLEARAQVTLAP